MLLSFLSLWMRSMKLCLAVCVAILLPSSMSWGASPSEAQSDNWAQWRGPDATGASQSANPPTSWSETENIKWKVAVPGKGSSSPIVWGDRVYVMSAVMTDRQKEGAAPPPPPAEDGGGRRRFGGGPAPTNFYEFLVLAYDRNNGKEVWRSKVTEQVPHESGHNTNTFASSSPVTDGERIYADFGSRGVFCLDMNGKVLWNRDFGLMKTVANFGEGTSPALYGDTLVVPWDHEGDSFIVALNAVNGEEKWKVNRDEGTTWATPLITEFDGRVQVITNGKNRVRSYDLKTGEIIWECGGQASNPIPSPVRYKDNVICMTGFRGYAIYSIPLSASGDITDTDRVNWIHEDAAPYVPSPVLYNDQLYFTKSNNGVLLSRRADNGDVVIDETRVPDVATVYASPVAAGGRVYLTSRDGTTVVLKHGAQFEVLATNKLNDTIDGSAALAGNELFLRGSENLYCIAQQ